jgi:hypothetical protein
VEYFTRDRLILVPVYDICPACKEVHRTAQSRH